MVKAKEEKATAVTLEDVFAIVQQIQKDVADLKAGVPSEPKPVEDFWAWFVSQPNPDPAAFEPVTYEVYSRDVLMQWRAQYSPLGVRVYGAVSVPNKMDYVRKMRDPLSPEAQIFIGNGVEQETAVYAILSGRCNEVFGSAGKLGDRAINDVLPLKGKTAEELFARDIAGAVAGGHAGQGGEG